MGKSKKVVKPELPDPEEAEEADAEEDVKEEDEEQEEEEEEEEAEDPEIDVEAIAQKAVDHALLVAKRQLAMGGELKLDVGLGSEHLYFSGQENFDTAAIPGWFKDSTSSLLRQPLAPKSPLRPKMSPREVRAAPVRPVDDAKERRAEAKKQREEKLEKWFGLPKHKMTPELEKELKALRLRNNFDPKRFYKANDKQELPKYFTIATEVGGAMAATGYNTKTREVSAHSGRSFLDTLLRDQKVGEWTAKKKSEVADKHLASLSSGHGKRKHEGARSTKRGGSWKKKKRS